MKIINNQGKLFNVINIVDLTVLIIIGAVILGGVYKYTGSSPLMPATDYSSDVIITVKYITSDVGELNAIEKGDQLVANNMLQPIFVDDVIIKPQKEAILQESKLVEVDHPFNKEIYITIKGQAHINGVDIHMANQIVRIGSTFYLKTLTTEFISTISNIEM